MFRLSSINFDALDYVAQPVFVLRPDKDGRPVYIFWNRAAENLSGHSRHYVYNKTARDIYPGAFGEGAQRRHEETLHSKQAQSYDIMLSIDDEPIEVRVTLHPILNYDDSMLAIVGTSVVLTSLRASQQLELETYAMIERARDEMERYLAFAAHDLRAPMRQMAGLAEMLQEELPADANEARELASMMEQVSQKAQELITDVLKFSEATNATVKVESFDLRLLARDIFTVLDPAQRHDLGSDGGRITGDRTAVQIILRNLVDNAIKHSEKDRIWLRIQLDDIGDGLDLLVLDNGPGLPEGTLDFLEGKSYEYGQGFGLLGLRRLVQIRQGTIQAVNRPEGGTMFRIHLPNLRYQQALEAG